MRAGHLVPGMLPPRQQERTCRRLRTLGLGLRPMGTPPHHFWEGLESTEPRAENTGGLWRRVMARWRLSGAIRGRHSARREIVRYQAMAGHRMKHLIAR
jgi:hypothetical protein